MAKNGTICYTDAPNKLHEHGLSTNKPQGWWTKEAGEDVFFFSGFFSSSSMEYGFFFFGWSWDLPGWELSEIGVVEFECVGGSRGGYRKNRGGAKVVDQTGWV